MVVKTGNVLDFEDLVSPDYLATEISRVWREYGNFRNKWLEEKKELRNYLFATDTKTTTNSGLSWSNSTTTPKLTQIRDNLHANYMASLFPNRDWLKWEGSDLDSTLKEKARVIEGYIKNKSEQQQLRTTVSRLVLDYIDYGNVFGIVEYVSEYNTNKDGTVTPTFIGPRLSRISPYDIVFNPTASSFEDSPKIIKKIVNIGDIKKAVELNPEDEYLNDIFNKMVSVRNIIRTTDSEIHKSEGYTADGFSNITHYYDTDYVELLTFYGNIYDKDRDEYRHNRVITVADRCYVIKDEEQASWLGSAPIFHVGWRERPDNLYAMGPLDNLVGLQYRIDHLENLKADVWDQIAFPIMKIKGEVEAFDRTLGANIYVGDEGDVTYLAPDATALNADLQIDRLVLIMEEMAGAPKQAMGIRTPGEKTAFEVDTLMNAADRIFRHKTSHFEEVFLEPCLNAMLESARRNLDTFDIIRVLDDGTGLEFFTQITKEDIKAKGRLKPVGARHFAERNTKIQNLNQLIQLKVNDPSIGVHLSGKQLAKLLSEELKEESIFGENIAVFEQLDTQRIVEEASVQFEEEQMVAAEQGL